MLTCTYVGRTQNISREIGILKILRHNNIVPLWGVVTGFGQRPELRCLVFPWMPNGTLDAYLTFSTLTVLDRSRIVSHSHRILSLSKTHLKLEAGGCQHWTSLLLANILIDKGGHARLIDFGLSTITQPLLDQSHLAVTSIHPGTIRYAAPELVLPDDACELPAVLEKADIYSFGCIMLQVSCWFDRKIFVQGLIDQVLSGRRPWSETTSEGFIIIRISQGYGPQRPDGHPAIIDSDWTFIQKCLQSGPGLRPSADEVLDFVMHRFHSPGNSA
ncbi:kinase-like domain-containing protein [Suillus bovinus]|uniref:kinase-like domain-containing protein n=1 Tax=Suillus bovinus TaxID=48563 RepID=UPI001B88559C|nr:kinase-like domain-containing protein [Suillus bovinus]KAG2158178.1 kinase-like domain-containing protein [Suillus bovinus]